MQIEFFDITGLYWLIPSLAIYLLISFKFPRSYFIVKVLELLVLTCCGLVLLDPRIVNTNQQQGLVIALDSSASITPEVYNVWQQKLINLKENKTQKIQLNYLNFAESTSQLSAEIPNLALGSEGSLTSYEELVSSYPNLPILLFSDGVETSGAILSKLDSLELKAPKIYPILPEESLITQKTTWELLDVPLISDSGSVEEINLILSNLNQNNFTGMVKLFQEGKLVKEAPAEILKNSSQRLGLTTKALQVGLNKFKLQLVDQKTKILKEHEFFITAKQKTKILLLSSSAEEERQPLNIIKSIGYLVEGKIASEFDQKLNSEEYSLVILNNVPYRQLGKKIEKLLPSYIEKGGGLLMIGGNQSFGLGGYLNTDIAETLPVTLTPPQKVQKRLNVAVQLVLDKSGSMKNASKIDFTRLAAKSVVDALKDDDYFGLIGFDNQPFVAYRLRQLKEGGRLDAARRVNLLFPNGGTNLYPALDLAKRELESAKAGRKHIIVLTDGQLPDASRGGANYLNLARTTKSSNISISTFLIGGDDSTLLREIAQFGGGKYHRTVDSRTLPKLFLQDVRINTADKTQQEFELYQVQAPANSSKKEFKNLVSIPAVDGYIETKLKDKASLDLMTPTRNNDPILASWKYGLGKTAALTTDASGRWTRRWLNWQGIGNLWSSILENLVNSQDQKKFSDFDLNYTQHGAELAFDLNIYQENFLAGDFLLEIKSAKRSPVVDTLSFTQSAKGRFHASSKITEAGWYLVTLFTPQEQQYQFKIKFKDPLELELAGGSNPAFLSSLAFMSGGEVNPDWDTLAKNISTATEVKYYPLWPYLIFISLVAFLTSILLRR